MAALLPLFRQVGFLTLGWWQAGIIGGFRGHVEFGFQLTRPRRQPRDSGHQAIDLTLLGQHQVDQRLLGKGRKSFAFAKDGESNPP